MKEAVDQANALLVGRKNSAFLVGVRAPISNPQGAEKLCFKFSGGGRTVAAGKNNFAPDVVDRFYDDFDLQFSYYLKFQQFYDLFFWVEISSLILYASSCKINPSFLQITGTSSGSSSFGTWKGSPNDSTTVVKGLGIL